MFASVPGWNCCCALRKLPFEVFYIFLNNLFFRSDSYGIPPIRSPIKLKSILLESRTSTLLPFYLIPLRIFYSTISWSIQPKIPLLNTSPTGSFFLVNTTSRYASALVGVGGAKSKEVPQQHPWTPLCSPLCDQKKNYFQISACRTYSYIFRLWQLFAQAESKQKPRIGLIPSCKSKILSECFPRMSDLAQEHCLLHIQSKTTSLKYRRRLCHHLREKGFEDCKTILSRCPDWQSRSIGLDFLHID